MDFTPRAVDEERARRYVAEGFWDDESLGALLADGLRDAGVAPVHRALRSDAVPRHARRRRRARPARRRRAARARHRPGDAVAFQLPNWLEAAATFYAITYLGAVVVPIVHFYGPKEVGYILRKTRVKALITADRFGASGLPRQPRGDARRRCPISNGSRSSATDGRRPRPTSRSRR